MSKWPQYVWQVRSLDYSERGIPCYSAWSYIDELDDDTLDARGFLSKATGKQLETRGGDLRHVEGGDPMFAGCSYREYICDDTRQEFRCFPVWPKDVLKIAALKETSRG